MVEHNRIIMFNALIIPTIIIIITRSSSFVDAIPIDNEVFGEPTIDCASDSISASFHTKNIFDGKIFIKGYATDPDCLQYGVGTQYEVFVVHFDRCGVRRTREINGVSISATIIISFHRIFLTKVDRAYRLSCFYLTSDKRVTQEIEVSMMTTQEIRQQSSMPICRYEILEGGPNGHPIRYARIGDHIFHKWTCIADIPDVYCMRVHSCVVNDGQGGEHINVLDENGCQIDRYVLQNLEYTSDMMAGQEAHVFKFADRPALYFGCQIEITLRDIQIGCRLAQPNCVSTTKIIGPPSIQPPAPPSLSIEPPAPPSPSVQPPAPPPPVGLLYIQQQQEASIGPPVASNEIPASQQVDVFDDTSTDFWSGGEQIFTWQLPQSAQSTVVAKQYVSAPAPPPSVPQYPKQTSININQQVYNTQSAAIDLPSHHIQFDRLIRKKRSLRVADFDLPEQSLLVFGIEDGPLPSDETLTFVNDDGNSHRMSSSDESLCLSTSRFAAIIILLIALSIVFVATIVIVFGRRSVIFAHNQHKL